METQNSITEEYEERVLATFRAWYRQNQPTINEAAAQAQSIASNAVGSLTLLKVLLLLREHPEWTYQPLSKSCNGEEITISGVTRMHLIAYLEQVIQARGLKTLYVS